MGMRTSTRGPGRIAVLASAAALALSGCALIPFAPGGGSRSGAEVGPDDVITLSGASFSIFGQYGSWRTVVDADSVTYSFTLPDGAVVAEIPAELEAEDRDWIERMAGEYLDWERTNPQGDDHVCMDAPSMTVAVTGSMAHESTMQLCGGTEPLDRLRDAVDDAESPLVEELVRPYDEVTYEIIPWSADGSGPDPAAPVERYHLAQAEYGEGMPARAENAPAGWGQGRTPVTGVHWADGSSEDGVSMGWDGTATVLQATATMMIGHEQLGCSDQTGQIRVAKEGYPAGALWTERICAGEPTEDLVAALRGF